MSKRNVLICTVGTSLFYGNLSGLTEKTPNRPDNWENIKSAYENKNWTLLARELLKLQPYDRICGAEINTIYDLIVKKRRNIDKLYLLVSDTEDGENTGRVLQEYFKKNSIIRISEVEFSKVEKLQDKKPKDFKSHGLRNLIREIAQIIQRVGGQENVMIDATGGYKAQIAIAVLIGIALNIPVSYKHERFSEIIDFPPMPISFDYSFLGEYSQILSIMEKGNILSEEEIEFTESGEKILALLEEMEEGGKTFYSLNYIGQILLTSYRLNNKKRIELRDAREEERKEPSFRKDHYPKNFIEYMRKVWKENKWIKTAYTVSYNKQKAIKGIGFSVKEIDGKKELVATYCDKNNFGSRFKIICTDDSEDVLTWAALELNTKYGKY
ncbi:putative CRISPR-associated protein [Spirochaetia bacterium 38H-sp]|uniref:CRISPR-associated protein n=1 Tax=Rarispira pelagica TaxID=3141764 RepID=A0ABU9U8K9_9SPIR